MKKIAFASFLSISLFGGKVLANENVRTWHACSSFLQRCGDAQVFVIVERVYTNSNRQEFLRGKVIRQEQRRPAKTVATVVLREGPGAPGEIYTGADFQLIQHSDGSRYGDGRWAYTFAGLVGDRWTTTTVACTVPQ